MTLEFASMFPYLKFCLILKAVGDFITMVYEMNLNKAYEGESMMLHNLGPRQLLCLSTFLNTAACLILDAIEC